MLDGSLCVKLKINCVVIRGWNDCEIFVFVEMICDEDIEVWFIEYMFFDGNKWVKDKMVSYGDMVELIWECYFVFFRLFGYEYNVMFK